MDYSEYLVDTPNIKIKTDLVAKIVIFGVIGWIALKMFIGSYGNTKIGSFFEKSTYIAKYWVYLQPDNSEVKNYRVQGDIEHSIIDDDDASFPRYNLLKVYWDNGGYTEFEECILEDKVIKNTGYVNCLDNNDNYYEVRLGEIVKN